MIVNRIASSPYEGLINIYIKEIGKTLYNEGDFFDISNYTIYALFGDGTSRDVTSECIYNLTEALTLEDNKVIFSYTEEDFTRTAEHSISVSGLYTWLDYIESTGTEWIDTQHIATNNTNIELDFEHISGKSGSWIPLLGQRITSGSNMFGFWVNQDSKAIAIIYGTVDTSTISGTNGNGRHVYKNIGNQFYLDGALINTITTGDFVSTQPLALFGLRTSEDVADTREGRGRVYSLKIYEGDVLVKDFIPALRNADREIGLYDRVNAQFHSNRGVGTFISPLGFVDGYQQLQYVEATGYQYIDTGFVPTPNTKVEADFAITDTRTSTSIWPAICGAQNLANSSDGRYFVFNYTPSTKTMAGSMTYTVGTTYNMALSVSEGIFVNGINKAPSYNWVDTPTVSLALCTRKSADKGFETCMQAVMKLYRFKIFEAGELIRYYIPAKRISDGAIGLYDYAYQTFHTSQGSSAFVGGVL